MKIQELLAAIPKRRVLVVGDAILDVTHHGRAIGPSVEDPHVTVYAEERVEPSPGGASLAVRNLLVLGAQVRYVTVLGDDANRASTLSGLTHPHLICHPIVQPGRRNTVKQRFWCGGRLVLKWNVREDRPIAPASQTELLAQVRASPADVVVVADFGHGVLAESVIIELLAQAKSAQVPVYLDSQVTSARPSNHRRYQGVDVVCCNLTEAHAIVADFQGQNPEPGLREIQTVLSAGLVVVKLGAGGSVALVAGRVIRTPAHRVTAVDTLGAGDAFLAALAAAHGAPWEEALEFANRWAALSTTVLGPNPPSLEALRQSFAD